MIPPEEWADVLITVRPLVWRRRGIPRGVKRLGWAAGRYRWPTRTALGSGLILSSYTKRGERPCPLFVEPGAAGRPSDGIIHPTGRAVTGY